MAYHYFDEKSLSDFIGIISDKVTSPKITKTLPATGWDATAKTQSIDITGSDLIVDGMIIVAPSPSSFDPYSEAGIRMMSITETTATFQCTNIPTVDVAVNIGTIK